MTYLGGATVSWQSDYAQFYIVDADDMTFEAPVEITDQMMRQRWHRLPSGLVVYTNDCLQQLIEVRVFSAASPLDPNEWRSGRAWTQTETTEIALPSRRFALSSPSRARPGIAGPYFGVEAARMTVRILWMELIDPYDDSPARGPDVIRLDLWPA